MDKKTLRRIGWIGASLGLTSALVGCNELQSSSSTAGLDQGTSMSTGFVDGENGLASLNGFGSANGLTSQNGLSAQNGLNTANGLSAQNGLNTSNGLGSVNGFNGTNGFNGSNGFNTSNGFNGSNGLNVTNGLNLANGLNTTNGLYSQNGFMTTDGGRMVVQYLVKCALAAGDTLVKQDQNGKNYTFAGSLGLAPDYKANGCGQDCSEMLSACLMAHINTTGVHIPLWMTAPMTSVGWGQSPYYPTSEGTFFGQIFLVNPAYNLDAYFCNGPSVTSDVVPGRLGSNQGNTPYANAYPTTAGMDGLCATAGHCSMHALTDGETLSDGAESCVGNSITWTHPMNVWRGQIFQAENAQLDTGVTIQTGPKNSGGKRVGNIGPSATVTFKNVMAGAAGSNNLVVYFADGDSGSGQRFFNVKVNGGGAQNKAFNIVAQGDWTAIGQMQITLSGFTAGSTNTVQFMGDGTHAAPDLDWIEVMAAPSTSSGGSTSSGATNTCAVGHTVGLQSMQNLLYASARQDNNNNLMAQAATIQSWETFDIVDAGGGMVALKSHMNNNYVTADLNVNTSAPLRARSTSIGAWEKYTIVSQANGYFAFKANANGKFVSVRVDQTNSPLQASAGSASSWEMFTCD
jgi:hypothetical protein